MNQPIPPVRGAHVINLFVGFGIDPTVTSKTTRKRNNVRPCAVENRELQIAVKWCGIYRLPLHNDER